MGPSFEALKQRAQSENRRDDERGSSSLSTHPTPSLSIIEYRRLSWPPVVEVSVAATTATRPQVGHSGAPQGHLARVLDSWQRPGIRVGPENPQRSRAPLPSHPPTRT